MTKRRKPDDKTPVKVIDLFEALRLSLLEAAANKPCATAGPKCDPVLGGAMCEGQ